MLAASSWDAGMWVQRAQEGGRGQPCPKEPGPRYLSLDRIPLHKFTSVRRAMSEVGGPVEKLIANGSISKYAQGVPAVTGGPVPEVLKNYMDVSVGVGCPLGGGGGLWGKVLASCVHLEGCSHFQHQPCGLSCPVWEELLLGHTPCLMGSHLWGLHSSLLPG